MDVIEAQEGALTASVKAYWSPAPQWCYGSILVRQPSRGSGAFLDEAIRLSPRLSRYSFQPIVVFDAEGRMIAAVLRPACRPDGRQIVKWLRRLIAALREN
jgi:hypothetical protein